VTQQVEVIDRQTGEITTVNPDLGPMPAVDGDLHQQITTARRYPRSVKKFRDKVLELATLNEAIAGECIYALPRGGKVIEGPSVRFAEIVQSAWGNCRVGGKVVAEDDKFLICQGMFHDLESNSAIAMETRRRITDSKGKRYNDDMVGVAGAAGTSIAIRNAVLRGVPKAFWADLYEAARQVVAGDFKTLANRRAAALQAFVIYGVTPDQIYTLLGVQADVDVTLDHLVQLRGVLNAIKDGSSTVEEVFGAPTAKVAQARPEKPKEEPKPKEAAKAKAEPGKAEKPKEAAKPVEEVKPSVEAQEGATDVEISEGLEQALSQISKVNDIEELRGMANILKEELHEGEYSVWEAAAKSRAAVLTKGGKK
jgi:hypothetical protein